MNDYCQQHPVQVAITLSCMPYAEACVSDTVTHCTRDWPRLAGSPKHRHLVVVALHIFIQKETKVLDNRYLHAPMYAH